jgi:Group II intron, maturase-specific domain
MGFRRHRSQPIERVINLTNPMLRGWVNYFAVGHSSECFSFIKDWVEKKVRRHLAHARKRKGFGWERWSRLWLYDTLGLFNAYRVRRDGPKVALQDRSINVGVKQMGARSGEIRMLRATWRGLETWYGQAACRRASPRPYR